MSFTDTTEKGLEAIIEASLLGAATEETERLPEEARDRIERYVAGLGGYVKGSSADYDRTYRIDRVQLFRFLKETQPDKLEKLGLEVGGLAEEKFLKRLSDQVKTRGVVDVLRKGIKDGEVSLNLYYKLPASSLNPKAVADYKKNIFSVTRQLRFSSDHTKQSLDMAIFINGLPVITFELKNQLTKQNVKDAMRQYMYDRDPKEPLFALGRCLVHFAVDDNLVYMTTHLRGGATVFLPFNKGLNEGRPEPPFGAGNPVNPRGLKTDYLWKEVLTKQNLSNIIEKYAHLVTEKDDKGKTVRKLVFPRYHQLDLVQKLLSAARSTALA